LLIGARKEEAPMGNTLQQQVAIITGGSGGIGLATARLFLEEGARVVLVDLEPATLEQAVARLDSPHVLGFPGDVSRPEVAAGMVRFASEEYGGVDILFANAGIEGAVKPLADYPLATFERVLDVNVLGTFLGIQAVVPAMVKRKGGSILVTASVAGVVGSPGLCAYVASKHAVLGLMKTAALELGPLGIRVNALAPGPVDNRMMRSIEEQAAPGNGEAVKAGFASQMALGRYGTNEEIAQLALFLASPRSSNSTGAVFFSDGGFVAR
jgi:NAD(P)-dependent dehydrogenase (short-subunit alcohol dehydrogenase family)